MSLANMDSAFKEFMPFSFPPCCPTRSVLHLIDVARGSLRVPRGRDDGVLLH